MRNERGITLVALVVTIVVLLILAGVTITYALSNNGIFTKAKEAGMVSEQATVRDAISNAQAEAMMEYYDSTLTTKSAASDLIKKYIPSTWSVSGSPTASNGVLGGTVTITGGSYTHTVTITNGVASDIKSAAK